MKKLNSFKKIKKYQEPDGTLQNSTIVLKNVDIKGKRNIKKDSKDKYNNYYAPDIPTYDTPEEEFQENVDPWNKMNRENLLNELENLKAEQKTPTDVNTLYTNHVKDLEKDLDFYNRKESFKKLEDPKNYSLDPIDKQQIEKITQNLKEAKNNAEEYKQKLVGWHKENVDSEIIRLTGKSQQPLPTKLEGYNLKNYTDKKSFKDSYEPDKKRLIDFYTSKRGQKLNKVAGYNDKQIGTRLKNLEDTGLDYPKDNLTSPNVQIFSNNTKKINLPSKKEFVFPMEVGPYNKSKDVERTYKDIYKYLGTHEFSHAATGGGNNLSDKNIYIY
jgi:hypothetical protein